MLKHAHGARSPGRRCSGPFHGALETPRRQCPSVDGEAECAPGHTQGRAPLSRNGLLGVGVGCEAGPAGALPHAPRQAPPPQPPAPPPLLPDLGERSPRPPCPPVLPVHPGGSAFPPLPKSPATEAPNRVKVGDFQGPANPSRIPPPLQLPPRARSPASPRSCQRPPTCSLMATLRPQEGDVKPGAPHALRVKARVTAVAPRPSRSGRVLLAAPAPWAFCPGPEAPQALRTCCVCGAGSSPRSFKLPLPTAESSLKCPVSGLPRFSFCKDTPPGTTP